LFFEIGFKLRRFRLIRFEAVKRRWVWKNSLVAVKPLCYRGWVFSSALRFGDEEPMRRTDAMERQSRGEQGRGEA
jgi:hypothetical protein